MNPVIVDLSKTPEIHLSINLVNEKNDLPYEAWKYSLIGRLDFVHLKFSDAATILRNQWKLKDKYQLIPLGKGFFTIKLSSIEDKEYITSGKWEVQDQVLRVRNWIPNFRPENQRTSKAMVWVHYRGLSLEYWDEETLFTIIRAIGTPIKVDAATLQYQSGYYAKVLIEIDLAKTIPNKLWIITKYGAFSQGVTLTKIPKFCTKCKIVGHHPHVPMENHSTEVTEINSDMNVINSTVDIKVTHNPFEVLQENDNELTEPEDGEIKEINATNLLEFGTIPQNIIIIPRISTSSQSSEEVGSYKSSKKKPHLKPAVVTRKSSKESLKHMIDKGSLSPQPPPFK
ncbi:uncharacterized protein LOC113315568 [Papaver somniferum]|uniref:uncharacterized protein LOC113315568 n=1 Tax=Papaver somniferum TaxID=3469 RepID=UPI000E6F4803|nr:uncharacterized protein LOC113315568 [Papaver somniferum]